MADPNRRSSPLKWILIGCGCALLAVLAGVGSCVALIGVGAAMAKKEYEACAAAGQAYLFSNADVKKEAGAVSKAESSFLGSRLVNDKAHINFAVQAEKGAGSAIVHLVKRGGAWTAVGCSLTLAGTSTEVGEKVDIPQTRSDWDD
jgi:hypothetical protein